jgi:hypothetical protein
MITFRFEFKDDSTFRTRTIRAHTLGEAQAFVRKEYPTWQVLNIWERKEVIV